MKSSEYRRSWKQEYEGQLVLDIKPIVSQEELPFKVYKGHIDINILRMINTDKEYILDIAKQNIKQNVDLFIKRYEWKYKDNPPFKYKWIRSKYKELKGYIR